MEPEDDKQLWDVLGRVPGPIAFAILRPERGKKDPPGSDSLRAGAKLV